MGLARPGLRPPGWLRCLAAPPGCGSPRVYGAAPLSGVALVATTYGLFAKSHRIPTAAVAEGPSRSRHTGSSPKLPYRSPPLAQTLPQLVQRPTSAGPQTQDQLSLTESRPARARIKPETPVPSAGTRTSSGWRRTSISWHRPCISWRTAVHQIAQAGSVQAAQRAADSHQLLVNSGIALAIVAVLALLVGWLVAGRMLRPIRTITRTARGSPPPACTSAWPSTARRTSSRNSGTPSTTCSAGSTLPSRPNATSSPTPRTSCARR